MLIKHQISHDEPTKKSMALVRRINSTITGVKGFVENNASTAATK